MAFQIIRDDITKVSADAIVNTANPKPTYAAGTDGAIYKAAGTDRLLEERKKIGKIETGHVAVTPAFDLDAKYIIHTVGPAWIDGDHGEREAVRSCYSESLKKAKELGCESIAFPLIATGVYGFPKDEALQIAISVFSEFLTSEDMKIILVVFDTEAFVLSGKVFDGIDAYIDDNYVEEKSDEEYGFSVDMLEDAPMESRLEEHSLRASVQRERSARKERKKPHGLLSRRNLDTARSVSDTAFEDGEDAEEPISASFAGMAMASKTLAPRSLDDVIAQVSETWQQSLFRLIDDKGLDEVEVYKRANVDRKLFSKIRSNVSYQPKKITVIGFALALELNLDETRDFLGRAGYALSPGSLFDVIVQYFIEQEVFDTYTINLALFDHGQPCLGE